MLKIHRMKAFQVGIHTKGIPINQPKSINFELQNEKNPISGVKWGALYRSTLGDIGLQAHRMGYPCERRCACRLSLSWPNLALARITARKSLGQ